MFVRRTTLSEGVRFDEKIIHNRVIDYLQPHDGNSENNAKTKSHG